MAYNNIDQAVTYAPNRELGAFAQGLYNQNLRQRAIDRQYQQDQQQRQDALAKYVGSEFDNKDFMTASAYDPLINQRLAATKQKIAGFIQKNPNMSMADLQYMMQKDMSEISALSSSIKAARANIEQQAKTFEKYPGIDANALRQLSLNNFLYKVDPTTGVKTLKQINEIDPSADYVAQTFKDHPELVTKGDSGFRAYLKNYELRKLGNAQSFENDGITRKQTYDLDIPDFMEPKTDAKGWVTGAKVRSENIGGMEVADQDVYNSMATDPSTAAYLATKLKRYNETSRTPIDPESPEAEILKRKFLYDELTQKALFHFKPTSSQTESNLRERMDAGLPVASYRAGLSDAAKLLKENQKLTGLNAGLIMRGLGGDQTVLEGAPTKDVDGKTYYDLASTLGGVKLGYDKDKKVKYASELLLDPVNKSLVVIGTDGSKESYAGKDIRSFIKRTSEYNGVTLDKADKTLNMYMDKDGRYVAKDNTAGIKQQQEARIQEAKIEAEAIADKFTKTKSLDDLSNFKGKPTKDGSEIKQIDSRNSFQQGLGMDPYYIILKNGTKKTFKTAYLLAEYLKNNVK